jgi:hypothetical protein
LIFNVVEGKASFEKTVGVDLTPALLLGISRTVMAMQSPRGNPSGTP